MNANKAEKKSIASIVNEKMLFELHYEIKFSWKRIFFSLRSFNEFIKLLYAIKFTVCRKKRSATISEAKTLVLI